VIVRHRPVNNGVILFERFPSKHSPDEEAHHSHFVSGVLRLDYTDCATATCRRNLMSTSADRGVSRGQRGGTPTSVNLSFLDWSRYLFFQAAPNISSQGLSGTRSRPTATQKIW
jgi:hypothetical protein